MATAELTVTRGAGGAVIEIIDLHRDTPGRPGEPERILRILDDPSNRSIEEREPDCEPLSFPEAARRQRAFVSSISHPVLEFEDGG